MEPICDCGSPSGAPKTEELRRRCSYALDKIATPSFRVARHSPNDMVCVMAVLRQLLTCSPLTDSAYSASPGPRSVELCGGR